MSEAQRHDLTRIVLMVLFIGGLIAAAFWVLRPFLGAIIWAVMIVVATWPLMRQVQGALWGKRWLAVTAMTIVLLLVLVAPLSAAIGTVVANADLIAGWAKHLRDLKLPSPPPARTWRRSRRPGADRKSTRLNSSHYQPSRMPSSA